MTYQTTDAWAALADGTRRAIFKRLAGGPMAVGELADGLPVSRPAVSQHLRVLKCAGLVVDRAVGTRRVYQVDPKGVEALRSELDVFWGKALDAYELIVDKGGRKRMSQSGVKPVRKSIVVNTGIERAFTLFVDQFDAIKPREHNLLAVPIAETVFEPRVGGHIYDMGIDGSRCEWSRVLAYEPPSRVVFSWDIGPTWQLEADPAKTSEVEVRFIAESADRTRVELEHRHFDRHGTGWQAAVEGVDGDAGWPLYLSRYAELTIVESSR